MERLHSPTAELSRDLRALRLGQLREDGGVATQGKLHSHTLSAPSVVPTDSSIDELYREQNTFPSSEGPCLVQDANSSLQGPYGPTTEQSCVLDCRLGNKVPLVFSHLEPTQGGAAVGAACGYVSVPVGGIEPCACATCDPTCGHTCCHTYPTCGHTSPTCGKTCPSCGQRHAAPASLGLPSAPLEPDTLLDSLVSLSVSSSDSTSAPHPPHYHHHSPNTSESSSWRCLEGPRALLEGPIALIGEPRHFQDGPRDSLQVASSRPDAVQWARLQSCYGSRYVSGGLCGSCRCEAMRSGYQYPSDVTVEELAGYPSDVTVGELAGYLDQLLHLPQPMSEMAEFMYT